MEQVCKMFLWMGRHVWLGWLIVCGLMLVPVYWLTDTDPPFELISVEPATVKPGGYVYLTANVKRDTERGCGATYNRYLYSPSGFRLDMEGSRSMDAAQIEEMEKRTPGKMILAVPVPPGLPPGEARLVTSIHYYCNPAQRIWPIEMTLVMPFQIVP